jgi:hypothetical protein
MTRIDVAETDADFIEFEFPDEDAAERADRVAGFAAHTGGTTRQVRADPSSVEGVRSSLEAAGIPWEESESSITEDDMWPDEGGPTP